MLDVDTDGYRGVHTARRVESVPPRAADCKTFLRARAEMRAYRAVTTRDERVTPAGRRRKKLDVGTESSTGVDDHQGILEHFIEELPAARAVCARHTSSGHPCGMPRSASRSHTPGRKRGTSRSVPVRPPPCASHRWPPVAAASRNCR